MYIFEYFLHQKDCTTIEKKELIPANEPVACCLVVVYHYHPLQYSFQCRSIYTKPRLKLNRTPGTAESVLRTQKAAEHDAPGGLTTLFIS
jgi:hypothetical protein